MRILMWAVPFLPIAGGREVFTARLATALVARGHEVLVIAPEHGRPASIDPGLAGSLTVERLPIGALIDVRAALDLDLPTDLGVARARLAELAAAFDPDVAHAHALGPDLVLLAEVARARGLPIVVTDHSLGATPERARLAITHRVARIPDAVVAVSDESARTAAQLVPGLVDRLCVVRNGVPIPSRVTPVDPTSGNVLVIGRLSPEKGVAVALTAWSALARDRPGAMPGLVVVGDGPDRPALERLAAHLGVASQVEFTGWLTQDAVEDRYAAASLVLVPSLWAEPFGLVAAEAAAHGRAVVASQVGALPEVVVSERTGWLVQPGDILGLIGRLNAVLTDAPALVSAGAAAAVHAAAQLSMDACAAGYLAVYARVARA